MELIKLIIKGISFDQMQGGVCALLLQEEVQEKLNGDKFSIIIGGLEAITISVALGNDEEKKQTFIYSTFVNFFSVFKVSLKKIIIYKLKEGIFFSYLVCEKDFQEEKIVCRAPHALALAIYFDAPIYITKELLAKFSFDFEDFFIRRKKTIYLDDQTSKKIKFENDLDVKNMNMESLNVLLEKAVADEYYEFAVLIKEEIDKRRNN